VLNLKNMVLRGELFVPPDDAGRVEAYIPSMGQENHAANMVELPNNDLLCTWFAGSREGASDIKVAVARLAHGSAAWSAPVFVSQDATRSEQNPVLFVAPNGDVWLLYTAQETRGCSREEWNRRVAAGEAQGGYTMQWTAEIRRRISRDGGATWGAVETFFGKPSSFCRQPMVILSNGDWLFPMYYSLEAEGHANDYCVVQISTDQGATCTEYPVPESRGRVHMSVVEVGGGSLVAFFRSRAADRIYASRSADYGRTWTAPVRTVLPNNNASIQALRLHSGRIALIHNHFSANEDPSATVWPRRRYPVTVAISEDSGETFPWMRHVDSSDGFFGARNEHLNRRCAYPCIIQTRDGMVHMAYSYRDRQCIKYVRVSEDWFVDRLDYLYGAPEHPGEVGVPFSR